MTLAASVALISAGLALYVALLSRQLSRAPGWQEQRYFALAAVSVAAYGLLNVPTTAPVLSDASVVLCSRIQMVAAAVHTFAWLRYSSVLVGQPRSRIDGFLVPVLATLAALGLLTNALLSGDIHPHVFEPLGLHYRTASTTPAGDGAYAVVLGLLLLPIARFAAAWRRGVPNAGVQALALLALLAMGANDAFVAGGAYGAPYLVDIAFLLPIATVGHALTSRFVEDARAHESLRHDLQRQVADRTAELSRAQDALHRAEKLAALGQFAAGVAHEVNNPAAVLSANLHYLQENEGDALTEEGREALDESLLSVRRIGVIVRQLLDAGRLAATAEARSSVALRSLADGALSVARARFGRRVRLTNRTPEGLHASAQEGVLAQVLVNLVVNAVQAIPERQQGGEVVVLAEPVNGRVRIVVEDNGAGMDAEVLRRAFEPFFTTKPFGSGTGLGLAVSRGLVMSLGGDLRLESEPGKGTRAVVDLALAEPAVRGQHRRDADPATPRLRLLIVDDEPAVRSSLRRLLEPRYAIEVASGVDDCLAQVEEQGFDLLLCDVMMPAGGGERLYQTLVARAPALARRMVFLTGGAVTDAARSFLREQPQPVLFKPLDLDELASLAERMGSTGPPAPPGGSPLH